MRSAAVLLGALSLAAAHPVAAQGPELGAGPHLDRSETHGGAGSRHQGDEAPKPPAVPVVPEGQEAGKASAGPSQAAPAEDEDKARKDDERKATRSRERMKKRPGYQDDVQPPRAHAQ